MIILIPPTFDSAGHLCLPSSSGDNLRDMSRRVSRRATLDGSAVAPDYGYCVADRTFVVGVSGVSREQRQEVERLLQSYARVVVATDEGIFLCAPSNLSASVLTLLVMDQID